MEKRTLPAIYILDRHLYIIDVYFPYGRPAVHYIKRCTNAYLARIFHLFFAAIVVAQYASELISSTIRGEIFNPGTPLQGCFSMWKNSGFTTIFFVTSVLSTIATFTLGATLWQKNSFLKTVSALFLFSIVFSFSCSLFLTNEEIGSAVSYLFIGKFFDNSSNFFWLINTVQIAETTILGYIGYLRLKELEINETKR